MKDEKNRIEVMIKFKDGSILVYDEKGILSMNYVVKNKEDKFDENGEISGGHEHDSVYMLTLKLKTDSPKNANNKKLIKNLPIDVFSDFEKALNIPLDLSMILGKKQKDDISIIITEIIKDNIILRTRNILGAEVVYYGEKFDNSGINNESEIAFKAKVI